MSEPEVSEANNREFGGGGSARLCQMQQDDQEEKDAKETVPWAGGLWCPQSLTLRHGKGRGRRQGAEQKMRGKWTLCIDCLAEEGWREDGWKLERLWGSRWGPFVGSEGFQHLKGKKSWW